LGAAAHVVQSIAWLATIAEADAEHEHDRREPDRMTSCCLCWPLRRRERRLGVHPAAVFF
jgi:hypothetical protein